MEESVEFGRTAAGTPPKLATPELVGEDNIGFAPPPLDILPVSLGDVAAFSALKKSFLSIYGLDLPVPRGSRSVKRPVIVLESCADVVLIFCEAVLKFT